MTTVSVILPTYNEKDNITPLVEAVLRSSQHPTSVWVVDDDSPDGTWQRVAEMAAHDPRVHLIHRTDAKGLTSAIARGIRDSDGDIVVWMDCDFSMPPERIPALVNAIVRESADIAVGSRYVAGGADVGHSLMAQAFSRTINLAAGLLFGVVLQRAFGDQGITELSIPWTRLVVFVIIAGLVGVLAAVLPARRAAKLNVLRAITTE